MYNSREKLNAINETRPVRFRKFSIGKFRFSDCPINQEIFVRRGLGRRLGVIQVFISPFRR